MPQVPLEQVAVAEPVSGPVESVPVLLPPLDVPTKLAEQPEPQVSVAVEHGDAAVVHDVPLGVNEPLLQLPVALPVSGPVLSVTLRELPWLVAAMDALQLLLPTVQLSVVAEQLDGVVLQLPVGVPQTPLNAPQVEEAEPVYPDAVLVSVSDVPEGEEVKLAVQPAPHDRVWVGHELAAKQQQLKVEVEYIPLTYDWAVQLELQLPGSDGWNGEMGCG